MCELPMDINLDDFELEPPTQALPTSTDKTQEETRNCKTTTKAEAMATTEFADDGALLASLPKLRKLDESKLPLDNNENSLSVDSLIEILSSNESSNKLPPPSGAGPSAKKFPSPQKHLNGGKPMISKMKQVSKRQAKPVYQSQISNNPLSIKISIKRNSQKPATLTSPKKRSRKSKKAGTATGVSAGSDSDDAYVKRRKKSSSATINCNSSNVSPSDEPIEQSGWGKSMPKEILFDIFKMAVREEGSVPTACRLARVCSLWREVSLDTQLWRTIDLSSYFKEKNRTELRLKWFIENRMLDSEDINISFWKVTNTMCVLIKLKEVCPNIISLSLAGWRALSNDDLNYICDNFPRVARLDLSSINTEIHPLKTAVGLQSLVSMIEKLKDRLTHLNLAANRLSGIPQITNALTNHCPNLTMLDLSNVKTVAVSHGVLHVEKLQEGCGKLKVLRIANSHVQLSQASLQEQMASSGFPELEELSVASLADESRLMSDESLQRILKSSTKLKLLDVRGCTRLTHDSLIRIPAWDLKHLFLSGCSVTRDVGSGLELIASKWAHSLIEFDLAWATMQKPLDNALRALADKRDECPLNHLNLCGSAVSVEAVKEILEHCPHINSINLASCRGLPRGIKRPLQGRKQIIELRENLRNGE